MSGYLANKLSDANDLGYFADPAALNAAYPVGYPGAFAIVGSTDTIWVWDSGTNSWVDTGAGGTSTPGGSTTQVQYNNAGAFGGISGATTNGTAVSFLATSMIILDPTDNTKAARFNIAGNGTGTTNIYTLPISATAQTLTLASLTNPGATQSFTGAMAFTGSSFSISSSTATIGTSTATTTYGLGTGATLGTNTKTVNIGTAGLSISNTIITIGSAVAGALGSTTINSPTVALSALTTNGLVMTTGGNGVLAIAVAGTNYTTPTGTENLSNKTLDITNVIAVLAANLSIVDGTDNTKVGKLAVANNTTATTTTYNLPISTVTQTLSLATISGISQTFAGPTTFSGTSFNVTAAANVAIGTSTSTATYSIASGATTTGITKTVNIGINGVSGSTTTITIGSVNGTTTTFNGAVIMPTINGNTVPSASDVVALVAATQTFTNKTIVKPILNATNPTAQTYAPAAAGTATLDLGLSNQHDITMPAGNITIALTNDTNNQIFSVSITQDATGGRTVTWFGTIRWAGGSAPTLTPTASKRDRFVFIRTGSNTYDGMVMGMNI